MKFELKIIHISHKFSKCYCFIRENAARPNSESRKKIILLTLCPNLVYFIKDNLPFLLWSKMGHWTTDRKYCNTWRWSEAGSSTRPTAQGVYSVRKNNKCTHLTHHLFGTPSYNLVCFNRDTNSYIQLPSVNFDLNISFLYTFTKSGLGRTCI